MYNFVVIKMTNNYDFFRSLKPDRSLQITFFFSRLKFAISPLFLKFIFHAPNNGNILAALTYRRALDKHSSLAKRYRNNNFLLYACTCTTTIIYYYYIYFFLFISLLQYVILERHGEKQHIRIWQKYRTMCEWFILS